jgi:hypothetical protein
MRPETEAPRAPPDADRLVHAGPAAQMAVWAGGSARTDEGLRNPQGMRPDAGHRGSSILPLLARTTLPAAVAEDGLRHVSLAELAVIGRASGDRPPHPGRPPPPLAPMVQHAPPPRGPVATTITQVPVQAEDLAPATLSGDREMPALMLATQSDPAAPVPVPTRPPPGMPAPPGLAAQLAEAMRQPDQQVIRIQLAPEELGRVRITLQHGEAGMHLLIQCDRPETQDLMRRNASELARDLAEMGFEGLSLEFSNRRNRGNAFAQEGRLTPHADMRARNPTETLPPSHAGAGSTSGLDLRL